jgi:hypothetical protein
MERWMDGWKIKVIFGKKKSEGKEISNKTR